MKVDDVKVVEFWEQERWGMALPRYARWSALKL